MPEDDDEDSDDEKKEIKQSENVDDEDDNKDTINKQVEFTTEKNNDDNDDEVGINEALEKVSITSQWMFLPSQRSLNNYIDYNVYVWYVAYYTDVVSALQKWKGKNHILCL